MRIQENMDVQNNLITGQENAARTAGSRKADRGGSLSVSGANLKGESLVAQRQGLARKQALKVVSDAFGGEKKMDAQMQSIKDEIKRLQSVIDEKTADTIENDKKLKELQEQYGIEPDSEENEKLSKLAAKLRNPNAEVSDEELAGLSEYQQKALYYVTANQQNSLDIERAKAQQAGNVQGYADLKSERAKSQDMQKAQEAAEDIMEAANSETVSLLTQEAVDHIDEEQKEREEEAKKASEEKKEEKKKEAEKLEKEAQQQEMIENIKEHAADAQRSSADTKRAIARRERTDAERADLEDIGNTVISNTASIQDTQDAVNTEITNILNRLSLLSSDIKGSSVDSQI